MKKEGKEIRRYSEDFKKEIVRKVDEGWGISELSRINGVSRGTIHTWRRKLGTNPVIKKVVVELESDYYKMLEYKKKAEKLEQLIGKQAIKIDYLEETIKEANKLYKEDFKKKLGSK